MKNRPNNTSLAEPPNTSIPSVQVFSDERVGLLLQEHAHGAVNSLVTAKLADLGLRGSIGPPAPHPVSLAPSLPRCSLFPTVYDHGADGAEIPSHPPLDQHSRIAFTYGYQQIPETTRSLLSSLLSLRYPVAFEFTCVEQHLRLQVSCAEIDSWLVEHCFGQISGIRVEPARLLLSPANTRFVQTLHAEPPCYRGAELPEGFIDNLLHALYATEAYASVQILVLPALDKWRSFMSPALDLERGLEKYRVPFQENPLSDEQYKLARRKIAEPLFHVTVRLAAARDSDLRTLAAVFNAFRYGGRPLRHLRTEDYQKVLTRSEVQHMFDDRLTYHHGLFLSIEELLPLVSLPSGETVKRLALIAPKDVPRDQALTLGHLHRVPVRVSVEDLRRHLLVLGGTGTGKSTLLEHMLVDDLKGE